VSDRDDKALVPEYLTVHRIGIREGRVFWRKVAAYQAVALVLVTAALVWSLLW